MESLSVHAQNNTETEENTLVWIEDGESFDFIEFDEVLVERGNIPEAESIYSEWDAKRKKMLDTGSKFGLLDMLIKHKYALIQYYKNNLSECIVIEKEIEDYLKAHVNEADNKYLSWMDQICKSLRYQAYCYRLIGDYKSVIDKTQEQLNIIENIEGLDKGYVKMTVLFGKNFMSEAYYALDEYQKAINIDEELLVNIEEMKLNDNELINKIRERLVKAYQHNYRLTDAIDMEEKIIESNITLYGESSEETIESQIELADMYYHGGRLVEYEEILLNILPNAEKLNNDSEIKSSFFYMIAQCFWLTGQYRKAIEINEKVLDRLPLTTENQILLWLNSSTYYGDLRDYSNALKCSLKAWEIYKNADAIDETYKLPILIQISENYLSVGRLDDALNLNQQLLLLKERFFGDKLVEDLKKNEITMITRLLGIATACYRSVEQYDKALELDKESYEMIKQAFGNDSVMKLSPLYAIAIDYGDLGDRKSAWKYLTESLNESRRLYGEKSSFTINVLDQVAYQYLLLTLYPDEYFVESDEYVALTSVVNKYLPDPNAENKGLELYKEILNLKLEIWPDDDPMIIESIHHLARAYANSVNILEATPLYTDVVNRLEKFNDRYSYLTSDEKRHIMSKYSSIYEQTVICNLFAENYYEAFRILELKRARNLVDRYSEHLAKNSEIFTSEEKAKFNEYATKIFEYDIFLRRSTQFYDEQMRIELEKEHRNLLDEYINYKNELKTKYPKYDKLSHSSEIDLSLDKNILSHDTAFVEFMVKDIFFRDTEDKNETQYTEHTIIVAFILKNNENLQTIIIETAEDSVNKCLLYRDLLAYKNISDMRADNKYFWKLSDGKFKIVSGRQKPEINAELIKNDQVFYDLRESLSEELGDILLKPLESYLSNYSNLIISPEGYLNNIPFETLKFNGKNAVETFNISYVPSFSVLKLMHEADVKNDNLKNRQTLFVMGDAIYGDSTNHQSRSSRSAFADLAYRSNSEFKVEDLQTLKWNNLPGTREEIDKVSQFWATTEILRQESATETNLKSFNKSGNLSNYKYLLFATHGIFVPFAPELTSIVLSQGIDKDNDGYVTIGEWLDFDLNSDLVYLSACESGLGDYQAGEGIVGIPYALTIAGNKDTVMSLWKVDDKATAEFTISVFEKLSKGKSEVNALNETKREFISKNDSKYSDPSVWAAFLLYGI